jgi:hypothetical protein
MAFAITSDLDWVALEYTSFTKSRNKTRMKITLKKFMISKGRGRYPVTIDLLSKE